MAWNLGARARRAGIGVAGLASVGETAPEVELGPRELEALLRLGAEGFHVWTVRGWLEADQEAG